VGGWIIAPIAWLLNRVAKKDASDRAWGKLVWRSRGRLWVAAAAEHPEMIIRRRGTKKKLIRRVIAMTAARTSI
jgi:hypothetical protein